MAIEVTLNGLDFSIPTKSEHDWSSLTDWILEVNQTLDASSDAFIIPPGSANLVNGSPVTLYTVNTPADNAHIIFEYGITRITTGIGAVSKSETQTMLLTYDSVAGTWATANYGIGDASVAMSISGANAIQATATALTGTPSVSLISFRGRIIRT